MRSERYRVKISSYLDGRLLTEHTENRAIVLRNKQPHIRWLDGYKKVVASNDPRWDYECDNHVKTLQCQNALEILTKVISGP